MRRLAQQHVRTLRAEVEVALQRYVDQETLAGMGEEDGRSDREG